MPGAPFLYYGDEIGMAYRKLPSKEGGYTAPVPAPLCSGPGKNLGFSTGTPESLYLPVDPDPNAPTVEGQEEDPQSLLHYTRALIALRHSHPELQARSPFSVYSAEPGSRLFAYKRGDLLCALNPGVEALALPLDGAYRILFCQGTAEIQNQVLAIQALPF